MVIRTEALQTPGPAWRPTLDRSVQVRFTQAQFDLLQELAGATGVKLSAVIRNVLVCWAANHANEDAALAGQSPVVDVAELVAELKALEAVE